ncbi:DUF3298 domain-containing protein [Clostridium sp.]|uniref:DUF3298 and DUF4163 domain-containing protein n=1 Tax=Clostridium sp. TaxID=1506 RepID=UPI002FC5EC3D
MFVRNANSNYLIETDDEVSYVPLNTYSFNEDADNFDIDNTESDERYLPPFQNNPLTQLLFGPQGGSGGFPGGPGGGPGGGPPGPPPSMTPSKSGASFQSQGQFGGPQVLAVSPGSIRPCRYQFVYIWLRNGRSFWAWLTNVDRRTASGFRWNGRRWVYFGVDLRRIDYFECYGRNTIGNSKDRGFGPPFGPPSGGPSSGPGGGQGGPPGAPPSGTPTKPSSSQTQSFSGGPQTLAVSPGSIRPCLHQFVYIWLTNGQSFWAWLLRVDRRSASGFRWTGRSWTYFGVDLRRIAFFQCFGRDTANTRGIGGPPGAPPSGTPKKPSSTQSQSFSSGPQTFAVSPGSIRPCLYQFVYIWLKNGQSFWAWLLDVDSRTASGFRWTGRSWSYFGVSLQNIEFFQCFGRSCMDRKDDLGKSTLPDVTTMPDFSQPIPMTLNDNVNTMGNLANMQDLADMGTTVNIAEDVDILDMTDLNGTTLPDMNGATNGTPATDVAANLQTQTIAPTEFKVDYPIVTGLENEEVQSNINDIIISEVTSLLNNQVIVPEQKEIEAVDVSYQVPLKENGLICIVFSIHIQLPDSKEDTIFSSLTFDCNTGEKYEFEDLFNPNTNYKDVLSDIAIEKCNENGVPFISDYEGVTDSQQFYLTPKGIVLFYQPHEYTPSSYGLFRIPISYDDLVDLLSVFTQVSNIVNHNSQV